MIKVSRANEKRKWEKQHLYEELLGLAMHMAAVPGDEERLAVRKGLATHILDRSMAIVGNFHGDDGEGHLAADAVHLHGGNQRRAPPPPRRH